MADQVDNLNPKFTKAKEEDKIEVVMVDAVMISEVIKIDTGQIVETGDSIHKIEVDQGMNKIIEEEILEVTQECIKILEYKIVEENTEVTIEMKVITEIGIGTGLGGDHFLETSVIEETIAVLVIVGPDQNQGQAQIETESGATNIGNMVILQRTSREERELEQLQQMLNLDGEQTLLKTLCQIHMTTLKNKF